MNFECLLSQEVEFHVIHACPSFHVKYALTIVVLVECTDESKSSAERRLYRKERLVDARLDPGSHLPDGNSSRWARLYSRDLENAEDLVVYCNLITQYAKSDRQRNPNAKTCHRDIPGPQKAPNASIITSPRQDISSLQGWS